MIQNFLHTVRNLLALMAFILGNISLETWIQTVIHSFHGSEACNTTALGIRFDLENAEDGAQSKVSGRRFSSVKKCQSPKLHPYS